MQPVSTSAEGNGAE